MSLINIERVKAADAWHVKVDRSNHRKYNDYFETGNVSDTSVLGDYIMAQDETTKSKMISLPALLMFKSEVSGVRAIDDAKSYCGIYTYIHGRVQSKFGNDTSGRVWGINQKTEPSIRGFKRDPQVINYARSVMADVIERIKNLP